MLFLIQKLQNTTNYIIKICLRVFFYLQQQNKKRKQAQVIHCIKLTRYLKIRIKSNLSFLKEVFVHIVKCPLAWQHQPRQRVVL